MDKKKVSVKINGAETVFKDSGQAKEQEGWKEQAEWSTSSHKVVSLAEHRNRKKPFLFRKRSFGQGEEVVRKQRRVGGKVAVIIIGAIIVGTILGQGLLGVVDKTAPTPKGQPSTQQTKQPPAVPANGSNVTLSALSLSVLQAGVFKTENAAKAFQHTWREKGLPATIVKRDNYYVLVGVGKEQASLEQLHTLYKEKNMGVFKKTYSIEESKLEVVGKENEEKLMQSRKMYEQLISMMDVLGKGKSVSADEKGEIEKIATSLQGEVAKELKPLIGALTNTYDLLKGYEQKKNEETLLKSQQALLDTMSAYYAIANIEE
ncbi:SPOR domain-containing protein [Priestia taiwanensis]|uniref:Stage II sporulation protein B n=1 Tax=Priestia taiwanensis TaxID=1347902 RepID=A0A917EQJ2_9BACI|nr:hypothetical protein [Priestia taiwanensis]MBM7363601.1 hypothetical protein [Priestia taiwanensis]GGE75721.1 stage II sporulation protein B [Priestia taiwanensis]